MITPESVTAVKSRGRAATREHIGVSPDAVQIAAGVCRGGSGHGAARPVGCQAGGGLPFWQEREVMRRVANRNPSAWLALSVKSLSVPGRLCILQLSIKTNAHLQ